MRRSSEKKKGGFGRLFCLWVVWYVEIVNKRDVELKTEQDLYDYLNEIGVHHETVGHKPCFSVAESEEVDKQIDAVATRNMFLYDKKKNYWLVTLEARQPVCLKKLRHVIGANQRLSFGKEEVLWQMLGVKPGSVTPFALINQVEEKTLKFVLDKNLIEAEKVAFHPLRNDKTTVVTALDFKEFVASSGVEMQVVDFSLVEPDKE